MFSSNGNGFAINLPQVEFIFVTDSIHLWKY